jgi:hypothetical protein
MISENGIVLIALAVRWDTARDPHLRSSGGSRGLSGCEDVTGMVVSCERIEERQAEATILFLDVTEPAQEGSVA